MERIITDNKWKEFIDGTEVPEKVINEDFDHLAAIDAMDSGFLKYKGTWYHVSDFERTKSYPGWDGMHGLGFFIGILIQISPDNEHYRIATVKN